MNYLAFSAAPYFTIIVYIKLLGLFEFKYLNNGES